MAKNVTDLIEMLEDYIINSVNRDYPEIDTSEGSPFFDFFVKPMRSILEPIIKRVNTLELQMDLSNAQYISENDLDAIGENNYFLARNPGMPAYGDVVFSFKELDDDRNLIIPQDTIVSTDDDIKFKVVTQYEFTPEEICLLYNPSTFLYEVTVHVEALEVGTQGNISANRITKLDTPFNNKFVSVTNPNSFTGGIDKESNSDYAERIKQFYMSRTLDTISGYERAIRDNFEEVVDLYVAGKDDPYMTRDLITIVDPNDNNTFKTVHIGGKTDIYVLGCVYNTIEEKIIAPENGDITLDLMCPLKEIVSIENVTQSVVYSINAADQNVYEIITHSEDYEEHSSREQKTLKIIEPTINPGDEIRVVYKNVQTIIDLNDYFNLQENRIVTSDVLFKEAQSQPVNIAVTVKMKPGQDFTSTVRSYIVRALNQYFETLKLGQSIDESAIIAQLRNDVNVNKYVDYVYLPLTSLYVPSDPNEDVQDNIRDPQPISANKISYLALNKVKINIAS